VITPNAPTGQPAPSPPPPPTLNQQLGPQPVQLQLVE
jgi:hypothetical protein